MRMDSRSKPSLEMCIPKVKRYVSVSSGMIRHPVYESEFERPRWYEFSFMLFGAYCTLNEMAGILPSKS
jgi:hypothetical protein